jgi:hypothetical protein
MSLSMPTPQMPPLPSLPQAPAPPPMFGQSQMQPGVKPPRKSATPTFLGTSLTPQTGQTGMKTLMGT